MTQKTLTHTANWEHLKNHSCFTIKTPAGRSFFKSKAMSKNDIQAPMTGRTCKKSLSEKFI